MYAWAIVKNRLKRKGARLNNKIVEMQARLASKVLTFSTITDNRNQREGLNTYNVEGIPIWIDDVSGAGPNTDINYMQIYQVKLTKLKLNEIL